ncbi:MAG: hypothetical protein CMN86_15045 [Stappia sp.]|jgi:hypothetical protein|uniref:hypothetical protein n=1 Tax=Stappia sp. TaxID=1870903 RepID=UPI000C963EA1|nr:hypothetical protein [Stappia sp.]
MIRFLLRILGLWLVALALVALVIDATGSIAASAWVFTPAGKYWFDFDPASLGLAQAAVQRHVSPMLWDPVIQTLLEAPVWAVAGPLGFVLLWLGDLGRRRRRRGDALPA